MQWNILLCLIILLWPVWTQGEDTPILPPATLRCYTVTIPTLCRWRQEPCPPAFSWSLEIDRQGILSGARRQDQQRVDATARLSCPDYCAAVWQEYLLYEDQEWAPLILQCGLDDPCQCGQERSSQRP